MSLINDIRFFAEDGTAGIQYKNFLIEIGIGRFLFGIAYNDSIGISLYAALVTISFFFGDHNGGDEIDE
jgi:hypothetical protein